MADNNEKDKRRKIKKEGKITDTRKFVVRFLKITAITILIASFIIGGVALGFTYATIKSVPHFEPTEITSRLHQTSVIYDDKDEPIEKIQTEEFRTVIKLSEISENVKDAFISIEDERFYEHKGIDIKSFFRALVRNIKAGEYEQGFSSITQQLARNIYLSKEKTLERKIKEMFISLELEKALTKDQILEAYLNTIYLGQGAHGIQAASQTYFSKDAKDLSIAESAIIAGITKNPSRYALYYTLPEDSIDESKHFVIGEVKILGEKYIAVFNEESLTRQKTVLRKMLELGKISSIEYENAINVDIKAEVKPVERKVERIKTSYLNDFVKTNVIKDLMDKFDYSKEEATNILFTGGLKIYSTVNVDFQEKVEKVYNNLDKALKGTVGSNPRSGAKYITRKLDKNSNILNSYGKITYYKKSNIIDKDNNIIIEKGTYTEKDGDLIIKNNKINYRNLDISNHYEIDENKNLLTFSGKYLNSVKADESYYEIDKENKQLIIKKEFLDINEDFNTNIDSKGNLLIPSKYYFKVKGVLQPQSSVIVFDHYTGQIKAMIGGRGVEGEMLYNRAIVPRQPGSAIKPLSVFTPALSGKYNAASSIDDIPHYNEKNILWPKNWYKGYKGLVSLRYSVEQSINVSAVKVLKDIGIKKAMEYLTKFRIINKDNPNEDTFTTRKESKSVNDENLAAIALGGMSKGISPLRMTVAYGAIANKGTYTEPIAYTKVVDRSGKTILKNNIKQDLVVSEKVAYIMSNILRSVVTSGSGRYASFKGFPSAGKTGTTQNMNDHWFVGYTPYYTAAVWIGNDDPSIKLASYYSTHIWREVMKEVHEGLSYKSFKIPSGFTSKYICNVSGKLATDLCSKDPRGSRVKKEIFITGTQPRDFCDIHVEVEIDPNTELLVNPYCPPIDSINKVFIKRDPPYNPKEHNGIVPDDYKYEVPTEVSPCPEVPDPEPDEDEDKEPDTETEPDEETNGKSNIDNTDDKDMKIIDSNND